MGFAFAMVAAIAAALPPAGQAPTNPSDQTIVVTGRKDEDKAVEDFVRSLTPVGPVEQLSRFEHSVCPAVFGLPEPQAEAVANRIRLVAKTVGIDVARGRCAPNILLLVTSDKKAFLEELRRHRADDLGLSEREFRNLEIQPGPAAAWQIQGPPMTEDGVDLSEDTTQGKVVNRTIDPSSRITVPVHPQFEAAVVVVERRALVGLTVTQLADYTALRALTGADPSRLANSGAPTILHVLEVPIGKEAPITMTSWDFDFLKGFYEARRNLRTAAQRSAISRTMIKDLQKQPRN